MVLPKCSFVLGIIQIGESVVTQKRRTEMHVQCSQGTSIWWTTRMWEEDSRINASMVNHAHGLQVILQSMSNDDRLRVDELVQGLAH